MNADEAKVSRAEEASRRSVRSPSRGKRGMEVSKDLAEKAKDYAAVKGQGDGRSSDAADKRKGRGGATSCRWIFL